MLCGSGFNYNGSNFNKADQVLITTDQIFNKADQPFYHPFKQAYD